MIAEFASRFPSGPGLKIGRSGPIEHFIAEEDAAVGQVILDARAIPEIDVTAAEQLQAFVIKLREHGIGFVVAKAHLPLREAAIHLGLEEWFSEKAHFPQLSDAVAAFSSTPPAEGEAGPCPSE
jgi:SulP family sulfate permease